MIANYLKSDIILVSFVIVGIFTRYLPQVYYDITNKKKKVLVRKTSNAKARHIFYLYLFIFAGFLLRFGLFPYSMLLLICGIFTFVFGIAIGLMGLFSLNKQYSEELIRYKGGTFVTFGIYSIVRHPMRIGLFIELLGIVILTGTSLLLLPLIGVFALQYVRTKDEELMLKEFFGTAATEYISTVPKFNFAYGLYKAIKRRQHYSPALKV